VTPTDALTFYADYNEASRAPTVIELGWRRMWRRVRGWFTRDARPAS